MWQLQYGLMFHACTPAVPCCGWRSYVIWKFKNHFLRRGAVPYLVSPLRPEARPMIVLEGSNVVPIGAHQVQDGIFSPPCTFLDTLFSSYRIPVLIPIGGRQRIQFHVATYRLMIHSRVLFCGCHIYVTWKLKHQVYPLRRYI
jgi:hypothetical protein